MARRSWVVGLVVSAAAALLPVSVAEGAPHQAQPEAGPVVVVTPNPALTSETITVRSGFNPESTCKNGSARVTISRGSDGQSATLDVAPNASGNWKLVIPGGNVQPGIYTVSASCRRVTTVAAAAPEASPPFTYPPVIATVGPPPNDNFAQPMALTGPTGTAFAFSALASKEAGEPTHGTSSSDGGGASIWFTWTAPVAGTVSFDTVASTFDTTLAAYTGSSVGALTLRARNDDFFDPTQDNRRFSRISFTATAGTQYRIAVDGFNGDAGGVRLSWNRPVNDTFGGAQRLVGANHDVGGNSKNALKDAGEPNHAGQPGGASVWFRWKAPATGRVTINTFGSAYDTLLAVYRGSSVRALTPVASNNNALGTQQSRVEFTATRNVTYQIAVDGVNGQSGQIRLKVRQ